MALKSKFAKKSGTFKANKIFTDRVEPRAVFSDNVRRLVSAGTADCRKIITFYGKGGIGKTRLLKQIITHSDENVYAQYPHYTFHNIHLSLEAYDYANPLNVLTSLRSRIHGDGSLFDYALMQYYSKARVTMEEISQKNTFLSPEMVELLKEAIGVFTASSGIPKSLLKKGLEMIKDMHFKAKYREEIQELDTLNEFEIFERLPYYLGLCISHSASRGIFHILFLDSYESLYSRTEGIVSSVDHTEWLKELFLSSSRFLLVIASRDRLDWEKQDEDWGMYLDQHLLSNLSDEDCRWFLEQVPVQDPDRRLIPDIIRHAGGVPLYLDLCVDLYENAVNNDIAPDFSNFHGSATIIDRYMRHLKQKDQYAVSVLATLKSFDCDFAIALLGKQNLIYHGRELLALLEKSVFLPLCENRELYKVDESVRAHICEQMAPQWRSRLVESALDVILENRSGAKYPYYSAVLETVVQYPDCIGKLHGKLLEALEYFSSIGYWNELRLTLADYLESDHAGLRAVAAFTELMWLRRTGNLAEAEKFGNLHPMSREEMGPWFDMYRFFRIHVHHLLGNYDSSILRYRQLLEEMELSGTVVPRHIYTTVSIKYIDLLFLKGQFDEAMQRTQQLLADPTTGAPDTVELMRIKGHIFRFRKQYREAEAVYRAALELVRKADLRAFEGKLYTNLTEATCMTDPAQALDWYDKALERNILMNNDIEVGKAYAAGAVACAALGDPEQAKVLARGALSSADATGYRSGRLFALLALAFAHKQAGEGDPMREALAEAASLARELGVYLFLLPEEAL